MPSTSNVLDEALGLVKKRLAELDEERKRLERALAELGGTNQPVAPARVARAAAPTKRSKQRLPAARRRRGGTRADQAVALVESKPGITASEIAKSMKIKPNYLYRVLGELEKEERVEEERPRVPPRLNSAALALLKGRPHGAGLFLLGSA